MSSDEAACLVDQYRAGLEAQLALLGQLEALAGRQRETTEARDFERFGTVSDERDRLTRSLVTIEQGVARVRSRLAVSSGVRIDTIQDVIVLRRTAAEMINRILAADKESLKALSDAEMARRAAVASLERGETTLAAYRKVLAPPVASATLVNRRG
jgi:hypothetical protein